MRILIPIIAALATLPLPAVGQEQPACAPIDRIEAQLAAEYHETRVQQGVTESGQQMLVIYAAPDGAARSAGAGGGQLDGYSYRQA